MVILEKEVPLWNVLAVYCEAVKVFTLFLQERAHLRSKTAINIRFTGNCSNAEKSVLRFKDKNLNTYSG